MSELYSTSEMQGWTKEELIEEIISSRDLIEILKERCITVSYVTEVPEYRHGIPEHEVEDYLTAEECRFMAKKIEELSNAKT